MVPPVVLLRVGATIDDDGPRRRHDHALLGAEEPGGVEAQSPPHPRRGGQRNVAVQRVLVSTDRTLQPLHPRPRILRPVVDDPTGEDRYVSGPMCRRRDGGPGGEEDARGGDQLWRVCWLLLGGAV